MATATEEMQCEVVGCEFVTPPMEPTMAMQRLALHDKQVHSAAQVIPQQQPQGDLVKAKPDKVRRPELKKGISGDKFLHYQRQWVRYKRATGLADDEDIKEQLLSSCSDEILTENYGVVLFVLHHVHFCDDGTKERKSFFLIILILVCTSSPHYLNLHLLQVYLG